MPRVTRHEGARLWLCSEFLRPFDLRPLGTSVLFARQYLYAGFGKQNGGLETHKPTRQPILVHGGSVLEG